jgi:chemotaxis protein CheD
MVNSLVVGLGEIKISRDPNDVLVAYGLGSCLGIGMHDPVTRLAGMLHAILPTQPDSRRVQNGLSNEGHAILPSRPESKGGEDQSGKYVDIGIQNLLEQLVRAGADRRRIVVRMAGGANMLVAPGFSQVMNIGGRNVEAAQSVFRSLKLNVASQETGGSTGRTVRFYPVDGRMTIRTVGNQERVI